VTTVFVRGAGFSALSDCAGDVYTTSGDDLGPRLSQQPMQPVPSFAPLALFSGYKFAIYRIFGFCVLDYCIGGPNVHDRYVNSRIDTSLHCICSPPCRRECSPPEDEILVRPEIANLRSARLPSAAASENDMIVRPIYYVAHTARTCEEARANRCRPRACAVVPRSELRVHSKKY